MRFEMSCRSTSLGSPSSLLCGTALAPMWMIFLHSPKLISDPSPTLERIHLPLGNSFTSLAAPSARFFPSRLGSNTFTPVVRTQAMTPASGLNSLHKTLSPSGCLQSTSSCAPVLLVPVHSFLQLLKPRSHPPLQSPTPSTAVHPSLLPPHPEIPFHHIMHHHLFCHQFNPKLWRIHWPTC